VGSRTPLEGARLWAIFVIGINLAGAAWLSIYMAVVEHEGLRAVLIAIFAAGALVVNLSAARARRPVPRGRHMVRHGRLLLPTDFGVPDPPDTERIEPPQPKLGAPGSLN
jgi:hypothetical protein